MEIIVCKFGGTSVATTETIQQIATILDKNPNRRCVVVSAPGKAAGVSAKVTDMLIRATQKALKNENYSEELDGVRSRYRDI
jgi:aspartate kinase